jgi:hypothetical protein
MPIALRQTLAPSFAGLHERYPQRFVWTHKMVIRSPPLEMDEQLWGLLSSGPGPAGQRCHSMADGQIQAFDKSSVESA